MEPTAQAMSTLTSDGTERILPELRALERLHNVTIVFAVDAGSRSYGCNSEKSDHDIRFVYFKNDTKAYMTIGKSPDTIISNDHVIDLHGWDIFKAVTHLKESNPSIMEWLSSPIVYIDTHNFKQNCLAITADMHSHLSLMYHYFHMAQENYKIWIEGKEQVICKKYFYVIRPLASLVYIMTQYINHPDNPLILLVNFDSLIDSIEPTIQPSLYAELKQLVERKRHLTEKELCDPLVNINSWIQQVFRQFEELTKKDRTTESDVDLKVQSTIKTHRKLSTEAKKIRDIVASCGSTARSNYLTTIGMALQLVWLDAHPDKETREMPGQIHHLLRDLSTQINGSTPIEGNSKLDPVVVVAIRDVIDNLEAEERTPDTNVSLEDVYECFVKPGIAFLAKDNELTADARGADLKTDDVLSQLHFSARTKLLVLEPKRNDYAEFVIRNFMELLWLLGNMEETQSSRPKDILGVGDQTNTIPKKVLLRAKKTITELRPRYIVGKNDVLDNWFVELVTSYEPKVKAVQDRLVKIREEHTQKRLHYSVKNVSAERFDRLIWQTIGL